MSEEEFNGHMERIGFFPMNRTVMAGRLVKVEYFNAQAHKIHWYPKDMFE